MKRIITIITISVLSISAFAEDYSLSFDGASWIATASSSELNPEYITAEIWLKRDLNEAGSYLLMKSDFSGDYPYALFLNEGKAGFSISYSGGAMEYQSETELRQEIWHHLAFGYDGQNVVLYVNGIPEGPQAQFPGSLSGNAGEVIFGKGMDEQYFTGMLDEIRISNSSRYDGEFDPYTGVTNDILPFDYQIYGWNYGTGPFDHQEAADSTALYGLINGFAPVYFRNNWQYAVQQYYYGDIAGSEERLTFWLTDQTDVAGAYGLYYDPLLATGEYLQIDTLGTEARLDTGSLFDYVLEMYYDKFFLHLTVSKENDPQYSEIVLSNFAQNAWYAMKYFAGTKIDSSVVLCYNLAEGTGNTAFDSSYYGNDGTITGAIWDAGVDYGYPFYIVNATADDGANTVPGIDDDDYVTIDYNIFLAETPEINQSNINDLLTLSSGHSWLSGNGSLGGIEWYESEFGLSAEIMLSTDGGEPTISIGDTVWASGIYNAVNREIETYVVVGGSFGGTSVDVRGNVPLISQISSFYPNPFNNTASLKLHLAAKTDVSMVVYNIRGEVVYRFAESLNAGMTTLNWETESLSTGLYFAHIEAGGRSIIQKVVLLK